MKQVDNKYKCIPFWSWNDELDEKKLCKQIEWMKAQGVGGFFMHARGGLKTEYLSEKWFSCVKACVEKAKELNMEAYGYDENGWPSGFVGGRLLEDIENHDMYIEHNIGKFDDKADVSYDLSNDSIIKASKGENCLNIYLKRSASTADILNPQVVDEFIKLTHEEYKKRDDKRLLRGFFTDEPQYYRWGVSYTKKLEEYFENVYKENIFDGLGLLFVKKEGFREFRYKYYSALAEMLQKNFADKVYTWCEENGYKLTGHFIEETSLQFQMCCCGGVMPLYRYEHIPGIDNLGREPANILSVKQLGSASAQLGKKQVLTETFACCGWSVTPKELKLIAESQYVYGVNLMCQHLLPYSEHGQRKRDYPVHFSKVNPWVDKDFKTFNDYFSVLGELLANSTEIVNVAVLHPIKSAFIYYDKTKERGGEEVVALDNGLSDLLCQLSDNQLNYHFVDETILKDYGKVDKNSLICGKCKYDYVIIPKVYNIDFNTDRLLREYLSNGGKILLYDNPPEYIEGVRADFEYLKSNITLKEILNLQEVKSEYVENVRSTYRMDKNGRKYIYLVNVDDNSKTVKFDCDCASFEEYDIITDSYSVIDKEVSLKSGESKILYLSDRKTDRKAVLKEIRLGDGYSVVSTVDNYLTIDCVKYSTDGVNYGNETYCLGVFDELLKNRYKGKLYLKYSFNVKDKPTKCFAIVEKNNVIGFSVNGKECENFSESQIDGNMAEIDIAKYIEVGNNEIIISMNYYQRESVYYTLFDGNDTESLKNCLVYDSNVEAVYLRGDFGVDGVFTKGKSDNVILGENFIITKQKKSITSLIEDGFPFFKGDITLSQKINVKDTNCKLVFGNRFHVIGIKVNGKNVGKLMFDNEIDISKFLSVGENEIEITLTVGLRNLFGPFHTLEQENLGVYPDTFERSGSWIDGKSKLYRNSYSFIKEF